MLACMHTCACAVSECISIRCYIPALIYVMMSLLENMWYVKYADKCTMWLVCHCRTIDFSLFHYKRHCKPIAVVYVWGMSTGGCRICMDDVLSVCAVPSVLYPPPVLYPYCVCCPQCLCCALCVLYPSPGLCHHCVM